MARVIKILIFTTLAASLAGGLFPEVYSTLALSWNGLEQFYFWQFLTYIFVERGPLSFPFFLQIAFNMYLLWIFGSSLLERTHTRRFLTLYFGSSLLGGLSVLIFPHTALSGSINPLYALLAAWVVLNPSSRLLLFFAIPFKAEWLILGLVGASLLIDLSHAQWAMALSLAISTLYGYLFALITWREHSPFPFMRPFERKLLYFLDKKEPIHRHSKIYDIKSGAPVLDDDQFMDAMLDRISRHGEDSLTPQEKKRMKEISERKK
jgi:membrane associated rhomboid family serine protease